MLWVTFCVIITVSLGKGSTVFCNPELLVLTRENLVEVWVNPELNLTIFPGTGPKGLVMIMVKKIIMTKLKIKMFTYRIFVK